jgi:NAD-dependent deacetylase
MSAESGIATFRGQASRHWQQFKPEELASPDGWRANKQRVWAWYERRRAQVMAAQAHAGHLAIAQLAERLQRLYGRAVQVDVVTQNVDNRFDFCRTYQIPPGLSVTLEPAAF